MKCKRNRYYQKAVKFISKNNCDITNSKRNHSLGADFILCLSEINANLTSCYQLQKLNSTANKYYSSAGHHEQKNKKTTGQIKFLAITIRQQIKLVLQYSLCKQISM